MPIIAKALFKTILNEARFSDEDRKLVMRFIQGRNFKTTLEEWRKEQVATLDIEKTMEAVGPIRVDVEN